MADSELLSAVRNMLHILCTKEPLKLITPGCRWGEKLPSLPAPTVWWPNSHLQTELVYLHRGACAMVLDDCAYKVDEGTICIIPGGCYHYETPLQANVSYQAVWFIKPAQNLCWHISKYDGKVTNNVENPLLLVVGNCLYLNMEDMLNEVVPKAVEFR